jgi:hypothetical protein
MVDREIRDLVGQRPDRALEQLEADVWAGAALRQQDRHTAKSLAFWQLGALVIALATSAAMGISIVRAHESHRVLAPDMELAPSNLLLGLHP